MAMMLKHRGLRSGALAVALLAGTSLSASAVEYTLTFGAGTETGAGTASNTRTYSIPGTGSPALKVTVTGWSTTGTSPAGNLDRAWLGSYGAGLGVCSSGDGGVGCNDPQHQVDGVGSQDYILITFSMPVDPLSIVIDPSSGSSSYTADTDVRYHLNSVEKTLATIDGLTPSGAGTTSGFYAGSVVTGPVTVPLTAPGDTVQVLVGVPAVGQAWYSGGPCKNSTTATTDDCYADYWKLTSIKFDYTAPPPPPAPPSGAGQVPAPGAMALFGAALAGLAITRRRRV